MISTVGAGNYWREANTETVFSSSVYHAAQPGEYGGPPDIGGPPVAWRPGQDKSSHRWENMPSQPLPDNPNISAPKYEPPPIDNIEEREGYEGTKYEEANTVPPPRTRNTPTGEPPQTAFDNVASLNEQQCREALMSWVGQNFLYGKECAEEMTIQKIHPSRDLHYTLDTFCERRETRRSFQPYKGEQVDGPWNGKPPPPWDIPCEPEKLFANHVMKIEVPHTAYVTNCHTCKQRGFNQCYRCRGLGMVQCNHCGGEGRTTNHEAQSVPCTWCGSDGRRKCHTCNSDGRIVCETCDGHRQLRHFIQLTVTYTNHKGDFMLESKDLPNGLAKELRGVTILDDTMEYVWPIISYPVVEINQNSQRLVENHSSAFPNERILLQRQQLTALPVTECWYTWKDMKTRCFWVYGRERKCFVPDYPQKYCFGCTIL